MSVGADELTATAEVAGPPDTPEASLSRLSVPLRRLIFDLSGAFRSACADDAGAADVVRSCVRAVLAGFSLLDHQDGILRLPPLGTFSVLLSMSSNNAAASLRLLVDIRRSATGEARDPRGGRGHRHPAGAQKLQQNHSIPHRHR